MHIRYLVTLPVMLLLMIAASGEERPRARDLGIQPGAGQPGPSTRSPTSAACASARRRRRGDNVRTGVTAILPHGGNLFREKVPGAVFVGNAFGKLAGSTQVQELGTIESPIVLTNTLSVSASRSTRSSAGRWRSQATRACDRSTRWSARPTTAG